MRRQLRIAAVLGAAIVAAPLALAAPKPFAEKLTRTFPLEAAGALTVENPNGKVTVVGTDAQQLVVRIDTQIQGVDDAAIREGRSRTQILFGGDAKSRLVRTINPYPVPKNRWVANVDLSIEVPRNAAVTVVAYNGAPIHIARLTNRLRVKSVNGMVRLDSVTGPTLVETSNANVFARFSEQPRQNVQLSSVNGIVEVRVPGDARFAWVAETLKGELYTTLPNRGSFMQSASRLYRSSVNGGSAPVITTTSITAPLFLLKPNDARERVAAMRAPDAVARTPVQQPAPAASPEFDIRRVRRMLLTDPSSRNFALGKGRIDGDFGYATSMGNIAVAEVRGSTNLSTQAGEIVVGKVVGQADLFSRGGPINVGDVFGPLRARTGAGDVHVRAAHRGGTLLTNGGNIEVLFAGGDIDLRSGGGNVSVRRVASDVYAETKSGDVTLFTEIGSGDHPITARTSDGSIWLNVEPGRKADVDVTVITAPDAQRSIVSELPGLTITREPVGNRMRVRAVGKLNGGGERIELHSENGTVQITARPPAELLAGPR